MPSDCPKCQGTGFEIRTGAGGVLSSVRCSCEQHDRSARLLRNARIPRRYDHCTLDDFECHDASLKRALGQARAWIELWPAVRHGLFFHGPPGTGKTHLAVAIGRELVETKGAHVLFYEQRELLKALQGTFDAASTQRESQVLRPVLDAEVLILDDLGAGRTTPWARDVMHDVIAQRYNEVLPLIITSNYPLDPQPGSRQEGSRPALDEPLTLRDRLGDGLLSRLYEMCEIVPVQGRDYRIGVRRHSRS